MATNIRIKYVVDEKEIKKADKALRKLDKTTDLTGKEVKQLNRNLDKQQKELGQSTKAVNKLSSSMGGIVKIAAAAFSINLIKNFASELIRLSDVQAKSEAKLLTALKGREAVANRLMAQARELQKITLFGDEATIEAQAFLASLQLNEDAIIRLTPLVQDLATKMGGDLRSAADLIAKSVGSSTNALSRYGIEITGAVGSSERLESAINALNLQVGGQSVAAAKAGAGQLTVFSNLVGDMKENIGRLLITALNPMVESFGKLVIKVGDFLAIPLSDTLRKEKEGLNALVGAIINTNESQDLRNRLIGKLQKEYPDFLKNIKAEGLENATLRDRLIEVNKELENKIIIQVAAEEREKILRKIIASELEEIELSEKLITTNDALGLATVGGSTSLERMNAALEHQQGITKGLRDDLVELTEKYRGLLTVIDPDEEEGGGGGVIISTERVKEEIEFLEKLGSALQLVTENRIKTVETARDIELEVIDIINQKKDEALEKAEERAAAEAEILSERAAAAFGAARGLVNSIALVAGEDRKLLNFAKGIALAENFLFLARAIAATEATFATLGPLGVALSAIRIVSLIASFATQRANIAAVQSPAFHEGGEIKGALRHGDVAITAQEGEFMIKTKAVEHYGLQAMESINNMEFNTVGFSDDNIVEEIRNLNQSFANRPINMIKFDEKGFRRSVIKGINETIYVTSRYV